MMFIVKAAIQKLDRCFHLWEFIFKEQPDVGINFQREGPLRNIRK